MVARDLPARGAEAAGPTRRLAQLPLLPLDGFVASHDQLGDAVALLHRIFCAAQVEHHHPDLSAITGVDGAEIHGEGMLERQAAAGPHLSLIARRELDGESRRHGLCHARFQYYTLDRPKIESRVFLGTVGVAWKDSVGMELLDADVHAYDMVARVKLCMPPHA